MKDLLEKIFSTDTDEIWETLEILARKSKAKIPKKVGEVVRSIDEIKSFGNPENFIRNAPPSLVNASNISDIANLVSSWAKIVDFQKNLEYIVRFLDSVVLDPADVQLNLLKQTISETFTVIVFSQPHRVEEILTRFENLMQKYIAQYLKFHREHNEKLIAISPSFEILLDKIRIMENLYSIPILQPYCDISEFQDFMDVSRLLIPCEHNPTEDEIRHNFVCPECRKTFLDAEILNYFETAERKISKKFDDCMKALAYNLSDKIIDSEDDPVKSLVQAIIVSDLDKIRNIFSDKLLERIRTILED